MELLDLTDVPERVLVVVAHPDDIDFAIAGTAAVLTAAGTKVTYALCTSGEAGIPEEMDRAELAQIREREQRAAAAQRRAHNVGSGRSLDARADPDPSVRQRWRTRPGR